MAKSFDQLRESHVADYQKLFHRVSLNVGSSPAGNQPTNIRIQKYSTENDPQLAEIYFQFGRYLLISSSRPGGLPANLQGIWNKDLWPAWGSKWTTNINVEMNYWPSEVCNLAECHVPLLDLVDSLRPSGRKTAEVHYGCGGFVLHHNTDIWRATAPCDGTWGVWPMGAVWLSTHLYQHYEFNGDLAFLRDRAYPVMKEAAQFVLDFLVEPPPGTAFPGKLVTNPSFSPENSYRLPDGKQGLLTYACTMDLELIHQLFTECISAAHRLGLDDDFRERLNSTLRRLPPLQVGKRGQLQEWIVDFPEADPLQPLWTLPGRHDHARRNAEVCSRRAEIAGASRRQVDRLEPRVASLPVGAVMRRRSRQPRFYRPHFQQDAAQHAGPLRALSDRRQLRRHRGNRRDAFAESRRRSPSSTGPARRLAGGKRPGLMRSRRI